MSGMLTDMQAQLLVCLSEQRKALAADEILKAAKGSGIAIQLKSLKTHLATLTGQGYLTQQGEKYIISAKGREAVGD